MTGLPVTTAVVGPMATNLQALEFVVKTIIDSCPTLDEWGVIDMPWREEALQEVRNRMCRRGARDSKLVFAIIENDGNVRVYPPVQRAITLIKKALLRRGYGVYALYRFLFF